MTKLRCAGMLVMGSLVLGGAWTGCSSSYTEVTGEAVCTTGNLDPSVPIDTAQDWVTYADHLAILHVVSEESAKREADDGDPSTGFISRRVTLRVDDVLWSRIKAPSMPDEMTWSAAGWTYDGEDKRKAYWWGFPRLEVGHTYVVPVTRWHHDGEPNEWAASTLTGILPYDDGVLGEGETTDCAHPDWAPVAQRAIGQGAQALAAILDHTRPDPKALPYLGRDPITRFRLASR